jgi:hypothetical protein
METTWLVQQLAAGWGLDGPGIEFLWGRDFPQQSSRGYWITPGGKGNGAWP